MKVGDSVRALMGNFRGQSGKITEIHKHSDGSSHEYIVRHTNGHQGLYFRNEIEEVT